ncbi:D-alanine--D-alanine ligase [bacterium]|nr:D-alanine--D-alanine ligase [bacterium]
MKIIVLMGGESAERRVSLTSGEAVARALADQGHDVHKMDLIDPVRIAPAKVALFQEEVGEKPPDLDDLPRFTPRRLASLMETLDRQKPDVVFPMLHGGMGEDGHLQAALEMVGLPFVGSGSLASALAMHKPKAKALFRSVGVPTPDELILTADDTAESAEKKINTAFGFPAALKPDSSGSAVGLFILQDAKGLDEALSTITHLHQHVLVERFIPGKELTVTILGEEALPPIEIRPHGGVYDYLSKYTKGHTEYLCPAPLDDTVTQQLQEYGLKAHQALGCRHYSRVDFRMPEGGDLYCLEVNTIPGMTSTSLVPKAAKAVGVSFEQLVDKLAKMALP